MHVGATKEGRDLVGGFVFRMILNQPLNFINPSFIVTELLGKT